MKELECKSSKLVEEIDHNSHEKINTIYKEQKICGDHVANILINDLSKVNILVCGKTQTGKTGCMLAVIKSIIINNPLPVSNIFIITGLSSIDWITDTIARMPYDLRNNVFHRGNLKKLTPLIKNKKNCLILIDEIQIGGDEKHTISLVFNQIGLYDIKYLLDNDIKIVQFTATPDGHVYDILDWGNMSAIVKLNPGIGYISATDLFNSGRVKQYKSLMDKKAIEEIKEVIDDKYINSPMYHTIRIPSAKRDDDRNIINMFREVFGDNFRYEEKFIEKKKDNINNILILKPFIHTFIFIKDILRCAKTKYKRHLGIEYERYAINPYDSTIIQGSIGRLTGYDDNKKSICFTNIESIEKYQKLWDANFDNISIGWYSMTTTNGKRNNKLTFNSPKKYKNMKAPPVVRTWGKITLVEVLFDDIKQDPLEIRCNENIKLPIYKEKKAKTKSNIKIPVKKYCKKSGSIKNPFTKKRAEKKDGKETGFYKTAAGVQSKVNTKFDMFALLKDKKSQDGQTHMFDGDKHNGWKKGDVVYFRSYICYVDIKKPEPTLYIRIWHATAEQVPFNMYIDNTKTYTPECEDWLRRYGAIIS